MSALPPSPRRRRPAVLLLLGLLLGMIAPAVVATPASALPKAPNSDILCTTVGFSLILQPYPQTWSHVGTRNLNGYAYRHWMVQEVRGSSLPYLGSYVAKCAGSTLISSALLPEQSGQPGSAECTNYTDINPPLAIYSYRYAGERSSYMYGRITPVNFRYWQHVQNTLIPGEPSSYAVRC